MWEFNCLHYALWRYVIDMTHMCVMHHYTMHIYIAHFHIKQYDSTHIDITNKFTSCILMGAQILMSCRYLFHVATRRQDVSRWWRRCRVGPFQSPADTPHPFCKTSSEHTQTLHLSIWQYPYPLDPPIPLLLFYLSSILAILMFLHTLMHQQTLSPSLCISPFLSPFPSPPMK